MNSFQDQNTYWLNFTLIINDSRLYNNKRVGTYRDKTGNYVVKTFSQEFDLRVQFIILLNAFARAWACAQKHASPETVC